MRRGVAAIALAVALSPAPRGFAEPPAEERAAEERAAEEPVAEELAAEEPAAEEPEAPAPADDRLRALEEENRRLRDRIDLLDEEHAFLSSRIDALAPIAGKITGYLDFGFFDVQGDGTGIRTDLGHTHFPEYEDLVPDSWVFMGDPLSTAINARGDPAETGESRAVVFDPIGSGGRPTFVLNSVAFALFAAIGTSATVNAAFDLVPRGRDVSDPGGLFLGDYVDVKLAYLEYIAPIDGFQLSLFAGKFDSVLGIEYRSQDAPARMTVTPSLICRYTCGRPLGVKARAQLFGDALVLNVAITNGSHFSEGFPFHDEIDRNDMKTAAGRVSYRFPAKGEGIELGASGAIGAQDGQSSNDVLQWHFGFDLRLRWGDLDLRGEYVKGKAEGESQDGEAPCGVLPCLDYEGAYGLVGYRFTNWLMPYVRVDWRDALHEAGASFVYVSQLIRATGGVRLDVSARVIVKAEYTHDRELGRIPQFPNDVFTSALVVTY